MAVTLNKVRNVSTARLHSFAVHKQQDLHKKKVGESGDSWHTFHISIFHIFTAFNKTQLGTSTLGLQSELYKFHTVYQEVEVEALSLTSARVPTSP